VDGRKRGHGLEAGDKARVDGGCRFAVELLVDDGLGEGFKRGLPAGEARGEGASPRHQPGEFGVGGGEGRYRFRGVIGEFEGAA